ncbi:MAG: DoxX family protein [Saprospiraceae bacterium]|nr:DoxX family protein [Saprospiraceae bacterium]
MKRTEVIYWITTILFVLFEGVMPAFTSNSELAREGISHLGYPDYFRVLLTVFKVLGAIVLILPVAKGKLKEWAYAGFTFTIISAFISHAVVDGINVQTFFPLFILMILATSYVTYSKMVTT